MFVFHGDKQLLSIIAMVIVTHPFNINTTMVTYIDTQLNVRSVFPHPDQISVIANAWDTRRGGGALGSEVGEIMGSAYYILKLDIIFNFCLE